MLNAMAPEPATRIARRAGALLALLAAAGFIAGFGTPSDSADAAAVSAGPPELEALEVAQTNASPEPMVLAERASQTPIDPLVADRGVIEELEPTTVASLPVHHSSSRYDAQVVVTSGALRYGESLGGELRSQDVSATAIYEITRAMRSSFDFRYARPGHRYRLVQDLDGNPLEFRYAISSEESYHLVRVGDDYQVTFEQAQLSSRRARIAGLVETSLYGAISSLGENGQLAGQFADIFAWDVDFTREVQPGDSFQILYERMYRTDDDGYEVYVRPGRILAARYSGASGEYEAVLYEGENGREGYYRTDGSSVERQFLVAPLKFSRISSKYSPARRHPILKVTRPHHGIDYAAAEGAPIWAVADGTVIYRGWGGGFGNLVKVRHTNGYVSYYAHMSRFAKGLSVGQQVSQKETLGYVGHTGLATGPHVCFRMQRDGRYVNPMKVRGKAGKAVGPEAWAGFRAERDALLAELTGEAGTTLAAIEDAL